VLGCGFTRASAGAKGPEVPLPYFDSPTCWMAPKKRVSKKEKKKSAANKQQLAFDVLADVDLG